MKTEDNVLDIAKEAKAGRIEKIMLFYKEKFKGIETVQSLKFNKNTKTFEDEWRHHGDFIYLMGHRSAWDDIDLMVDRLVGYTKGNNSRPVNDSAYFTIVVSYIDGRVLEMRRNKIISRWFIPNRNERNAMIPGLVRSRRF